MDYSFDQLYSEAILTFISHVKNCAKQILSSEMNIEVRKNRFLFNRYSYPLKFVVFEHPSRLGYFNPEFYEIGIHKKILYAKDDSLLQNLLRHELAHYYCFIKYGNSISDHGKEYHDACKSFGWDKEVYSAYTVLLEKDFATSPTSNKILGKIQKLLSLATSPHKEESEAATLKANQLLIKHNLKTYAISNDPEMGLKRLLHGKKASTKLQTISSILRSFFIYPVISYTTTGVYLEIFGEKTNIDIAEYVGLFLDKKLEELWKEIQNKRPEMKGITKKNSFFRGIAKGYKEKIKRIHETAENKNGLLVIEKALQEHIGMAYPKLSSTKSSAKNCKTAQELGKKEGQNLNIHQAVHSSSSKDFYLS